MQKAKKIPLPQAVIFDMDGVITDTAELHFFSWKKVFDHFLENIEAKYKPITPFTKQDYLKFVDGIMRDDGIKNFLNSRKLLPSNEEKTSKLIRLLGNEKDKLFLHEVDENGAKSFPSSIKLVHFFHKKGLKLGVISSSKYCKDILKKAKVYNLFDAIVDGKTLERLNIPGKPNPGIFLKAAKLLAVPPENCMMVEDALSGVQAGRKGNFGLVVGIDRNHQGEKVYKKNGADIVVSDLSELNIDESR